MIHAFDTYYQKNKAKTAAISFESWTDSKPKNSYSEITEIESEYVSGEFYRRELPCIISLMKQMPFRESDIIVVDGFVILDNERHLGLGGYLYHELNEKFPVIGVAKRPFSKLDILKKEVFRGESKNPLYVTALGIDLEKAASHISEMHGDYRMPTLLRILDQLSRE